MPNLLDCPREIRDLCYKAYFESVVRDNSTTSLHKLPLMWSNRNVALEALEVCLNPFPSILSRLTTV